MWTAILKILGALSDLGSTFVLRRWKQQDDPRNQITKAKNENREAIANGTAGPRLDALLDRVHKPKDKAD